MEDVHERELVERCRSGDERAFQELVDRHKDLVFALIARTVQDRSRAEDLAQDVFLRIHRGTLVNLARIREVHPLFKGGAEIVLHDGTRLDLSRRFRAGARVVLGLP